MTKPKPLRLNPIRPESRTRFGAPVAKFPRIFSNTFTRTEALRLRDWFDRLIAKNDAEGWE